MSQLEVSTDAWRRLLAVLPDEVVIVDADGLIHHVGHSLEGVTGYSRAELVGQSIETLIPRDAREPHDATRARYASSPSARPMGAGAPYRLLRRDGAEVMVSVALSPVTLDNRLWIIAAVQAASPHTGTTTTHVAERLSSATLLAESEERFRLAFEANTSPMIFLDLDDRVTAANDAFCRLIGRERSDVLGRDSTPFTHPEDLGITEAAHERFLLGDEAPTTYVKRYVHSDGHVVVVEVSKSPARDASWRVCYFVVSERDVTAERLLVAQLS